MQKKISDFLLSNNITEFGFSAPENSPFPGLKNAITIVVPLSCAVIDGITDLPTKTYFHHYRTVNTFIDNLNLRLFLLLKENGFDAASVPASQSVNEYAGLFSHKETAVLSGLGYIGKSALFISHKYGPRVRLGTLFTNAPLDVCSFKQQDLCGDCNICAVKCPAMAIRGIGFKEGMKREDIFDAKACSDYMKEHFQDIGRGAVCGVCIKNCPKGRK